MTPGPDSSTGPGAFGAQDPYTDEESHRLHGMDMAVQEDAPLCLRCEGPGILEARVPHVWDNGYGEPLPCLRVLVLCPGCDQADPAAAELLALFGVDDLIDDANAELFTALVGPWVEAVSARPADPATLVDVGDS
ncbi:DUF6300 family protein [Yinghuangia soli]|uniref:DUF6300 family protein n=1 Tax=Yinghuangia soli TaxID=2908204 RepID=A0AA41Q307_9ACTN|nr:DUF6300 family protein [Yinghuangia soli]MCF2530381.1 DUF6300 family protein [Yinghuangia soli]